MLDTSARLLRLLSLLQRRRFWTGAELADRLEVTPRTVRRDVDRLRALGYPVSSSVGVAGGYQLGAGATLPPLLVEDDEALAIAIGLRTVAMGTVHGAEAAAVGALAKLERVLPSRLRRRFRNLRDAVVPLYDRRPQIDATLLTTLAAASRDQQIVSFTYVDREGSRTRRRVEPLGLVHTESRWYLAAYDLKRQDWRTFRVDRVEGRAVAAQRFRPRKLPDQDVAAFVARSIHSGASTHRARVLIHAPLERTAKRLHPSVGHLTAVSKRRCLLESDANSLAGLAWFIASLGEEFEVQSPLQLVDEIEDMASRLSRAAARSAGIAAQQE
ncbi:MAG: YafY family transcriptional regulator [Myxococcales bacterium FL481]|nr:MAG: YafY family transcriptional regulator [Myxococcales bacterium FL481]